jgi:2-aminoadipate transaminase
MIAPRSVSQPGTEPASVANAGAVPLAPRMRGLAPSAVREILKVADLPDVLSFAGGLPAPELFPLAEIAEAHARVFAREGRSALQYSTTEGHPPLRAWIAERLRLAGIAADADRILVTGGSQQGLDLVARALLEPGDVVLVEDPTYLAALQVFASHQARMVGAPGDDDGVQVEAMEPLILAHRPRLIYLVTEFGNPRGTSLSLPRRLELLRLARRHRIPILEDNPYGELRFAGDFPPSLAALDDSGLVIQLGTFSKTLAPGMRLGWIHGGRELLRCCTILKQAADLHTSTVEQRAAAALLETFDYPAHLGLIRRVYGERCQAMHAALEQFMPAGCRWTHPEGGLFLWLALPPPLSDEALFGPAIERKVAFVPGHPFFVAPGQHGFLRLNFSNRPPELIREGMSRLGETMREALRG